MNRYLTMFYHVTRHTLYPILYFLIVSSFFSIVCFRVTIEWDVTDIDKNTKLHEPSYASVNEGIKPSERFWPRVYIYKVS